MLENIGDALGFPVKFPQGDKMKKILIFLGILLIGALLYIFQNGIYTRRLPVLEENVISGHYPVTVKTYASNGELAEMVFSKKPKRVIADELNPFETLLALGQGDSIVGSSVSIESEAYLRLAEKYPDEIKKAKGLYDHDLDVETLIASRPDLILGWKGTFSEKRFKSTAWWNARGVNTYIVATANHILSQGSIEDECRFLADMGKIFNAEERAEGYIREIRQEIRRVQAETLGKKPQKVMVVELMGRSLMNYDSGWIIGDIVQQLGGSMPVKEKRIGYEDLLFENPEVIFVNYFNNGQKETIRSFFANPRFNSLQAVKKRRIYLVPFGYLYTPGIKTAECIRIIRDGLYPDLANSG